MSLKELEAEIKKLDLKDRALLAKRIVESLDELSRAEIEALWVEEAEHRLDEMEQGAVAEIPAEEALRKARNAIL
ncbi:MAG: addiction module protein [Syntrophobacteraceae bacterium]